MSRARQMLYPTDPTRVEYVSEDREITITLISPEERSSHSFSCPKCWETDGRLVKQAPHPSLHDKGMRTDDVLFCKSCGALFEKRGGQHSIEDIPRDVLSEKIDS